MLEDDILSGSPPMFSATKKSLVLLAENLGNRDWPASALYPLKASAGTFSPSAKKWWTRSQRIRTAGEIRYEVLLAPVSHTIYQKIASEVERLQRLGLSCPQIARNLCVDDKTIAKAL